MLRFFILFFLLINLSFSCISVYKELNQSKIIVNESVSVNIKIKNLCDEERIINVTEFFIGEVIFPKENVVYVEIPKGLILAFPPFLFWENIRLRSKEEKNITYIFRPLQVGLSLLQPTRIIDNKGNIYYSNNISFFVDCNHNKICEKNLGENFYDCSDDCPSGSYDGICDGIKDGICDPDCDENSDIDCRKICGNNICEIGENQENCCIDCGCPFGYFCKENKCEPYFSSIIIYLFLLISPAIFLFFQIKKFKK